MLITMVFKAVRRPKAKQGPKAAVFPKWREGALTPRRRFTDALKTMLITMYIHLF
jgi:hypothetical protein